MSDRNPCDFYPHYLFMQSNLAFAFESSISDMAHFAKSFNMNYKELKRHNPWLREGHLNNKSRRLYMIKIKP